MAFENTEPKTGLIIQIAIASIVAFVAVRFGVVSLYTRPSTPSTSARSRTPAVSKSPPRAPRPSRSSRASTRLPPRT